VAADGNAAFCQFALETCCFNLFNCHSILELHKDGRVLKTRTVEDNWNKFPLQDIYSTTDCCHKSLSTTKLLLLLLLHLFNGLFPGQHGLAGNRKAEPFW